MSGEEAYQMRKGWGVSQAELAKKMGVTHKTISKYEWMKLVPEMYRLAMQAVDRDVWRFGVREVFLRK